MKCYGKVINYDGFTGMIKGIDGYDYLLFNTDIMDKEIKENDYVSFDKDVYQDIELMRYIARFVNKINEEEDKD